MFLTSALLGYVAAALAFEANHAERNQALLRALHGFFYFLTYPPKKQFEKKPTSEWQSTPTYTPVAYCDEFAVTTMVKKRKTPSKSTQAYKKLARYRQAFDELDVTEDGELSAAELHTAMREKGLKLASAPPFL